jgi:hypothetical protein
LCCSEFAIIAFGEMLKNTITVSITDKCSSLDFDHPSRIVIQNRYRSTMSNDAKFEQWAKDYKIPVENMLLYHASDKRGTKIDYALSNTVRVQNKVYYFLMLLLFCYFSFFYFLPIIA